MSRVLAFVLGVVVCLLSMASVVAVWAHGELLDTDRYVESVQPLSSDPAIRAEVSQQVTDAILAQLPERIRDDVRPGIAAQGDAFVKSAAFPVVWAQVNRQAHQGLVAVLRDKQSSTVVIRHGRLFVDLTPVVDAVRRQVALIQPDLVAALPQITLQIDVADAHRIEQARTSVRWLDRLAYWLPIGTVALLLLTALVARRRLRAIGWTLLGVAVSMVVVWLGVRAGAGLAVDRVPTRSLSDASVRAVYGALTQLLRESATRVGVVSAVLGLVALAGSALTRDRGLSPEEPAR